MRYAEYLPSPPLSAIVDRYWILDGPGSGVADAIFPDGRTELIFHCGAAFRQHHPSGALTVQPSAILAGQILSPICVSHVGRAAVAGVRLRPESAGRVLREDATTFTERVVDLADVLPAVRRTRERLGEARTDRERFAVLEAWLLSLHAGTADRQVRSAIDVMESTGGRASIPAIARRTGISRRQFERRFRSAVGLSPRTFARVARLQQALRAIRAGRPLAEVAVASGYCDQAHMARDFRLLACAAPSVWQREAGALAPLFLGSADQRGSHAARV